MITIVLEDNRDKIPVIMERVEFPCILFNRWEEIPAFIGTPKEKYTLYLDSEVIGCADGGVKFLDWCIAKIPHLLVKVVITTMGPFAQKRMLEMCRKALIPCEIF